jgi:hypothetical protein
LRIVRSFSGGRLKRQETAIRVSFCQCKYRQESNRKESGMRGCLGPNHFKLSACLAVKPELFSVQSDPMDYQQPQCAIEFAASHFQPVSNQQRVAGFQLEKR